MGQMLVPALIGAGVGAVGGAVTGSNPFKTALLGAGIGASGAGLLGGASGATATTAAGGADLAAGTVAPSILGTPTLNASLLTQGSLAGLGATPSVYGGLGASSLLDKTGAFLGNMSTMDKINLGAKSIDVLNPPQQPIQPSQGQISRPNFDPSSTLVNVAPNVRPTEGSKTGLIDIMARIPMTDEEKLRLQQLAQYGYRG